MYDVDAYKINKKLLKRIFSTPKCASQCQINYNLYTKKYKYIETKKKKTSKNRKSQKSKSPKKRKNQKSKNRLADKDRSKA